MKHSPALARSRRSKGPRLDADSSLEMLRARLEQLKLADHFTGNTVLHARNFLDMSKAWNFESLHLWLAKICNYSSTRVLSRKAGERVSRRSPSAKKAFADACKGRSLQIGSLNRVLGPSDPLMKLFFAIQDHLGVAVEEISEQDHSHKRRRSVGPRTVEQIGRRAGRDFGSGPIVCNRRREACIRAGEDGRPALESPTHDSCLLLRWEIVFEEHIRFRRQLGGWGGPFGSGGLVGSNDLARWPPLGFFFEVRSLSELDLAPGRVNVEAFCGKKGRRGRAHFDRCFTFNCQVAGTKVWKLARNRALRFYRSECFSGAPRLAKTERLLVGRLPRRRVKGDTFVARPGSVVFLPPGVLHETRLETDSFAVAFAIDKTDRIADHVASRVRRSLTRVPELRAARLGAQRHPRGEENLMVARELRRIAGEIEKSEDLWSELQGS